MRRNDTTVSSFFYVLTAIATSVFMLSRNLEDFAKWSTLALEWLIRCGPPLLFAFAYPRFLFADSVPRLRQRNAAALYGVGAASTTVLFAVFSTPFWNNSVRDVDVYLPVALMDLAILIVFLVSAVSLLLRNRSSLAGVASFLFWPYWILLALEHVGRWFQDSNLHAAYYFLCFVNPALLVFAAGTLWYRRTVAHGFALLALVGVPWLYWDVIKGNGYSNVWLMFNLPEKFFARPLYVVPAILAVGLTGFAVAVASTRLLPSRWHWGKYPLSERTWPAIALCLILLAIWLGHSVLPYRIPGAVDL